MTKTRLAPIHPGVYLKELLDEIGLTQPASPETLECLQCGSTTLYTGNDP